MSASPWMKFYPRDWRGDQALRAVSLAARGLWIDCLCIMHEAQPYGHLVLGSQPVTDVALARMTGTTPDQISDLLGELESAAVFARRSDGTIYSRRMTRDFKKAKIGEKSAKKRWAQATEKQEENCLPNRGPIGVPTHIPITQIPDTRDQKERKIEVANATLSETVPVPDDKPDKKLKKRNVYSEAFESFWTAYPTDPLMSKKAASEVWVRLTEADRLAASGSVPAFAEHCRKNPDYRPVHACRFLSQRRFDGFAAVASAGPPEEPVPKFDNREDFKKWWRERHLERRQSEAIQ